jgi:ribosomal protein S1
VRLQRVDERNGYRSRVRKLDGAALTAHVEQLKKDFSSGPPVGRTVEGVVTNVLDGDGQAGWAMVNLGSVQGSLPLPVTQDRYNPKGLPATQRFAAGDVVRVRVNKVGKEGPI